MPDDFEKQVAGNQNDIVKLFSKGGAWGLMAFFIGLAFYTFFLIPSLDERAQMNQERQKFIDGTLETNASLRSITSENKETQKKMAATMDQIKQSVERQEKTFAAIQSGTESQNEMRERAIEQFEKFTAAVMHDHPEMCKKLDELLKQAAESTDSIKLDILIKAIEELKNEAEPNNK